MTHHGEINEGPATVSSLGSFSLRRWPSISFLFLLLLFLLLLLPHVGRRALWYTYWVAESDAPTLTLVDATQDTPVSQRSGLNTRSARLPTPELSTFHVGIFEPPHLGRGPRPTMAI